MPQLLAVLIAATREQAKRVRADDGMTAIEVAIFALLALLVAGAVAAAITAAVNKRTAGIS